MGLTESGQTSGFYKIPIEGSKVKVSEKYNLCGAYVNMLYSNSYDT